jgi:hypothetical protein
MERRWTKQHGRHPEAFQERPSGKAVIVSSVTRHPHGSRADGMLSPMQSRHAPGTVPGGFAAEEPAFASLDALVPQNYSALHLLVDKPWGIGIMSCPLGCNRLLRFDFVRSDVTGYLDRLMTEGSCSKCSNGPYEGESEVFLWPVIVITFSCGLAASPT